MTETAQSNNLNDKIASLTKEAENLKLKLEEERQKLNDVARKCLVNLHLFVCAQRQCLHTHQVAMGVAWIKCVFNYFLF